MFKIIFFCGLSCFSLYGAIVNDSVILYILTFIIPLLIFVSVHRTKKIYGKVDQKKSSV
jgi:hypothetical protein